MTKPKWNYERYNPHGNNNNYKEGDDANKDSIAAQDHIVNESDNNKHVGNNENNNSQNLHQSRWPEQTQK